MHTDLAPYLEACAQTYGPRFLSTDPLGEVRRFTAPRDLEVAGFLAAGLAFGQVETILKNLRQLWDRLDGRPAEFARAGSRVKARKLKGFVHRWVRGEDVHRVVDRLAWCQEEYGSLAALYVQGDHSQASTVAPAASRFVNRLMPQGERSRGVQTFFCDPLNGSACKRLCLFLRWMVRPEDGLDLGVFSGVSPATLVIPLDTHVARISRYLGLTSRRSADWKTACEVTDNLKLIDSRDPTRFDFALSRLGILKECPRRVDPVRCERCSLKPVCTLGRVHAHAG